MKNIIAFERGKSPKSGLGIGIEGMKKKHRIMVIDSEFRDLETASNSLFGADQFGVFGSDQYGKYAPIGSMRQIQDAYFVIIANEDKFRIVKMRYAPAHSEMSPSSVLEFFQNWDYPKERINDCIMWMAAEAENWGRKEDDYGFKL
jgi:hypothetical protein